MVDKINEIRYFIIGFCSLVGLTFFFGPPWVLRPVEARVNSILLAE